MFDEPICSLWGGYINGIEADSVVGDDGYWSHGWRRREHWRATTWDYWDTPYIDLPTGSIQDRLGPISIDGLTALYD